MLRQFMFEEPLPRGRAAVITPCETTSWSKLKDQADTIAHTCGRLAKRRIGLSFQAAAVSYAALVALDDLSCDVFLMDAELPREDMLRRAEKLRLGALL